MNIHIFFLVMTMAHAEDSTEFDIEDLVADPERLKSAVECLIDTEPCSELGAEYKAIVPITVEYACAKCTDPQKHTVKVFLAELKKKWPQEYEALVNKYDPEKKHISALEAAVDAF